MEYLILIAASLVAGSFVEMRWKPLSTAVTFIKEKRAP